MSIKAARVEDTLITNIAIFADGAVLPPLWVLFQEGMEIGGKFDGTTITPPTIPEPSQEELEAAAVATASKVALQANVKVALDDDTLSDEDYANVVYLYPEWSGISVLYKLDVVVRDAGVLYKVVQEHTSQAAWNPAAVPALFTPYRLPLAAWVQPTGAQDAYNIGDKVTHPNPNNGGNVWVYQSLIDANTTEPGQNADQFWQPTNLA